MNKVIYIFCFSLTINIHASHPLAEENFYQSTVNALDALENPLCLLDEQLYPSLNPNFSKELYQVHEEIWRHQINKEAEIIKETLLADFKAFVTTTYAQEQRTKTPLTPTNSSFTNSSIGYLNRMSGLSSSVPNTSFLEKK